MKLNLRRNSLLGCGKLPIIRTPSAGTSSRSLSRNGEANPHFSLPFGRSGLRLVGRGGLLVADNASQIGWLAARAGAGQCDETASLNASFVFWLSLGRNRRRTKAPSRIRRRAEARNITNQCAYVMFVTLLLGQKALRTSAVCQSRDVSILLGISIVTKSHACTGVVTPNFVGTKEKVS